MIKISDLCFKEDTHSYFLGDIPIPSVSEIIKPVYEKIYGNIDSNVLETASDKGTRVHRAIEYLNKYNLYKFDSDIQGYIKAYKNFRSDYEAWELLNSELRTYHKNLLYGMTIDETYKANEGIIISDIKTTKAVHLGAWSVQLSGYKLGFESQHEKVSKVIVLQLFENGSYKIHKLKDNSTIFLACLQIYKFGV